MSTQKEIVELARNWAYPIYSLIFEWDVRGAAVRMRVLRLVELALALVSILTKRAKRTLAVRRGADWPEPRSKATPTEPIVKVNYSLSDPTYSDRSYSRA